MGYRLQYHDGENGSQNWTDYEEAGRTRRPQIVVYGYREGERMEMAFSDFFIFERRMLNESIY